MKNKKNKVVPSWLFYFSVLTILMEWFIGAATFSVNSSGIMQGINYGIPPTFSIMLQRMFVMIFLFVVPVLVFLKGIDERQTSEAGKK